MSVQTQGLRGASAGGLADYFETGLESADGLGRYFATSTGTDARGVSGQGKIVFGPNQISGRAAAAMGLEVNFGLDIGGMERLLAGQHLVTGDALVRARGAPVYERDETGNYRRDSNGNKVRSLDADGKPVTDHSNAFQGTQSITAPPKSVDIAMIIAAKESPALARAIIEAHESANAEFLAWVQDNVALGRRTVATPTEVRETVGAGAPMVTKGPRVGQESRTQGSRTERTPVDLAMFSATQFTTRPLDDRPLGDPLIHTHNLFAKAAFDPATGRWGTIDEYALKEAVTAAQASAIYGAALHRRLVDLGFETEAQPFDGDRAGRHNWRIKGVSRDAERFFSSHHERIPALVADWEGRTGRVASVAMINKLLHDTKSPKTPESKIQDTRPNWAHWSELADVAGVELASAGLVEHIRSGGGPVVRASYDERRRILHERLEGPNGLTWKAATFTHHEAMSSLARCAEGLDFTNEEMATVELELLDATVELDALKPDGTPRDPRYVQRTTAGQLAVEDRIAAGLQMKADQVFLPADAETLAAALDQVSPQLDSEQLAAVEAMTSGAGVVFLEGYAGTGKTTLLRPGITALRNSGVVDHVVVVSTAALTATATGAKLGADVAGSLDSVAADVARGATAITERTLVIYDEAFMAETARADKLMTMAGPARVVFVGDPDQAQPIGAAGWYHDATSLHGVAGRLTAVHRQVNQADRDALLALREGRGADALDNLEARGRLHVRADAQDAFEALGEAYASFRDTGLDDSAIRVISAGGSNAANDRVNRLIQTDRLGRGEISTEALSVTETSTGRRWNLHAGDPVLFLAPYRHDGGRVANGTSGRIEGLDIEHSRANVITTDGTRVEVRIEDRSEHQPIAPAYAVHSQKYQGAETDVVLVVVPEPNAVDKFALYSAASRARQELHVFVDHETHGDNPKAALSRSLAGSPFPQSARAVQSGRAMPHGPATAGRPTPVTPVRAEPKMATKVDSSSAQARECRLARVVGPAIASEVATSPRFAELRSQLNQLEASGFNSSAMLANAARNSERLANTNDAAAELINQLGGETRVLRSLPAVPAPLGTKANSLRPEQVDAPARPSFDQAAIDLRTRLEEAQQHRDLARQQRQGPDFTISF